MGAVSSGIFENACCYDLMDLLNCDMVYRSSFPCDILHEIESSRVIGCLNVLRKRFSTDGYALFQHKLCLRERQGVPLYRTRVIGVQQPHLFVPSFYGVGWEGAERVESLHLLRDA